MAKIAIDAGHGKYTAGKRCLKSLDKNETREWILNSRIATDLEMYLKSAGHETLRVDDITGETDVSLSNRVKKANDWKADYYISIHHNAGVKGGSGGGTVVYKYNGATGKSKSTQEAIYEYVIKRGNLKGNRYDGTLDGNFYVIRKTSMPSSLIECGFMDSSTDIKYILDKEWSKKIALGIAEGICKVYGGIIVQTTTNTGVNKDKENTFVPYKVKIVANTLNIRKGAGTNYDKNGVVKKDNVYTIIDEATGKGATKWGKLKSGSGWISLDLSYVKKV